MAKKYSIAYYYNEIAADIDLAIESARKEQREKCAEAMKRRWMQSGAYVTPTVEDCLNAILAASVSVEWCEHCKQNENGQWVFKVPTMDFGVALHELTHTCPMKGCGVRYKTCG